MKILTIGSANYDMVYSVDHVVLDGETISAQEMEVKQGGKGLNQAIALARGGAISYFSGCIGADGDELINTLIHSGVNVNYLKRDNGPSGHAIIQLSKDGNNAIVIYGGSNLQVSRAIIDEAVSNFDQGDYLLLQNEISNVGYAIFSAKQRGMRVVLNPSPITADLLKSPLDLVDIFILNEIEGQFLAELPDHVPAQEILEALFNRFPNAEIVLTLGSNGVLYHGKQGDFEHRAYHVPVVDTTGVGDTFCGFYLACVMNGQNTEEALETASKASAIAVGIKGAAASIPSIEQVINTSFEQN